MKRRSTDFGLFAAFVVCLALTNVIIVFPAWAQPGGGTLTGYTCTGNETGCGISSYSCISANEYQCPDQSLPVKKTVISYTYDVCVSTDDALCEYTNGVCRRDIYFIDAACTVVACEYEHWKSMCSTPI